MASSTGEQIITIHILPKISRSEINQTTKFNQLECNGRKIFFKNHAENESWRLVPGPFLQEIKAKGQHLSFNVSWQSWIWTYNKSRLSKNLI